MNHSLLKGLTGLVICTISFCSASKTIATCNGSKGYTYYIEGDFVPKDDAGFAEDAISDGKITLERIEDEFKLSMIDVTGAIQTVEGQGGRTISMLIGESISVFVFYENSVEQYIFRPQDGIVTWTSARSGAFIDKHSLFVSSCKFL
jgi:hypothetical protein